MCCAPTSTTTIPAAIGWSGHGLSSRSTGHSGPRNTVPSIPVVPPPVSTWLFAHAPPRTMRSIRARAGTTHRVTFSIIARFDAPGRRPVPGSADRVAIDLGAKGPHEGQVPEPFAVVEPVPHDEHRRDVEPHVPDVDGDLLHVHLVQHGADLQAGRLAGPEVLQQV